ncbi:pseudouridine synthase [Brevibacterium sp. BRM-1]|uniref:pseudouridine synthase n=1 Tax=Brevibacterium sp. BRM-1 TaxID=2999062 RepID=UPI00227FD724|nr:pseudouridine synthase [Brevibacterium sp. BRM-1]WAL40133.1 pseudouridine synthase [Brevibacterium sp. BRM-1]
MRSPLPPREGISAARLRAPGGPQTHAHAADPVPATVDAWLAAALPGASAAERAALAAPAGGALCDEGGRPVALSDPVIPGGFYFFHRPVPAEARIPFPIRTVHEDPELLVIDKPAFLASTPNGRFVRECAVTRLRVERNEPDLVAIHRLDRVTSGLLVLSRRPATRGAYQRLFQERRVHKSYRALVVLPAGWDPVLLPAERASRLDKEPGTRAVLEVPGEPNALTRFAYAGPGECTCAPADANAHAHAHADVDTGRLGVIDLEPVTGRTHQLRVHLNALGLPILGDPIYPEDLAPDPYDFRRRLHLLARRIEFEDPLTGRPRRFDSRLGLCGDEGGASPWVEESSPRA